MSRVGYRRYCEKRQRPVTATATATATVDSLE